MGCQWKNLNFFVTFCLHSLFEIAFIQLFLVDALTEVTNTSTPSGLWVISVPVIVGSKWAVKPAGTNLVVVLVSVGWGAEIQVGEPEHRDFGVWGKRFLVQSAEKSQGHQAIVYVSEPCSRDAVGTKLVLVSGPVHLDVQQGFPVRRVRHLCCLELVTLGIGDLTHEVVNFTLCRGSTQFD